MDDNKTFIRSAYNDDARAWATRIRCGHNWAHEHIEKPAMQALLPELTHQSVLLVGCGSGEEAAMLFDKNPKSVSGIDLSDNLIALAASYEPRAQFHVMDFDELLFQDGQFDFVYSSLAFHYSSDLLKTLQGVRRVVRPGARIQFSLHHPLLWSADTTRTGGVSEKRFGYKRDSAAGSAAVYGDYFSRRWVSDTWFETMAIRYYHQPLSRTLSDFLASGFSLTRFVEPEPVGGDGPNFDVYSKIPLFLIISGVAV